MLISLVKKLKENIDAGKYDTLVSDDVGGRIPTLLLRKIIKKVHPEKELHTYFVASGMTYFPQPKDMNYRENYAKLQEYLRTIAEKARHVLAVTQFLRSGKTMARLVEALHRVGIKDVDIAALDNYAGEAKNVYSGGREWHKIHEEHEHLSGVKKSSKEYQLRPRRCELFGGKSCRARVEKIAGNR